MARIVALGITIVLLLATCFFGYSTHQKVLGLNDDKTALQGQLTQANQLVAKTKADLKTSQDETAQARKDADDAKSQLATAQSSLDAANAKVTSLSADLATAQAKIVQLTPTSNGTSVSVVGPTQADMDAALAKLKDATAQVAELTQVKDTLNSKVKDLQAHSDDLQKTVDHYKGTVLRTGLEGEVLAVNQGWSFVVLSIGDRQGAVTNAEMILKRGDSQIGKVRITSVEPSTSVADIIPGSLSRGVRVQPGDRVIFPGS